MMLLFTQNIWNKSKASYFIFIVQKLSYSTVKFENEKYALGD